MTNLSGLSKEQEDIVRRASNLENKEYIRKIEDAMEEGKRVEVSVTKKSEVDKYEFFIH